MEDKIVKRGDIVDGVRDVLTRGGYKGEEGVGHSWVRVGRMGDYSGETHGRLQGYREPIRIEILAETAILGDLGDVHGVKLILPRGHVVQQTDVGPLVMDEGLTADEALEFGLARIVER